MAKSWTQENPPKSGKALKLWKWANELWDVRSLHYNIISPQSHIMTPKYVIQVPMESFNIDDVDYAVSLSLDDVMNHPRSYQFSGRYIDCPDD